jgi:hypothetical protein
MLGQVLTTMWVERSPCPQTIATRETVQQLTPYTSLVFTRPVTEKKACDKRSEALANGMPFKSGTIHKETEKKGTYCPRLGMPFPRLPLLFFLLTAHNMLCPVGGE